MKFCFKCGAQLSDDSVFCIKCGTNVSGSMPYNPMVSAPPAAVQAPGVAPAGKPRKKLNPLLIILPVLLVVLAAGGLLYFTVFNTPPIAFIKANTMFFDNLIHMNTNEELASRLKNEDFEASFNLTVKDVEGTDEITKQILDKLKVAFDLIKIKNQGGVNFSAEMGNAEVAKFSAIMTTDKFIAGILQKDKAVSAAYADLPADSETPALERLYYHILNLKPDARIKALLAKLQDAAVSSIDTAWFSVKPENYINVADKSNVSAQAYTLTLDGKAVRSFIKNFAKKLEEDPTFYKDLEDCVADNVKETPKDLVKSFKKALKDAELQIGNDFEIVWTAYQTGGKTSAIEIRAELTGAAKGSIELLLQSHEKDAAKTATVQVNFRPETGSPYSMTEQIITEKNADGMDLDFSIDWSDGKSQFFVTGEGTSVLTKKSASEYSESTTLTIKPDIPGAAQLRIPKSITLNMEGHYIFGGVNFENNRYFRLKELEEDAKKQDNINDVFTAVFGGMGAALPFNFNSMAPGDPADFLLPEFSDTPAPTDTPPPSETPAPSETPEPSKTPAPDSTTALPVDMIADTFTEFNKDNWFFYDFAAGKLDDSYIKIDNGSLVLPCSTEEKTVGLFSDPVVFKSGDTVVITRNIKFEGKGDGRSALYVDFDKKDGSGFKNILMGEYNFGPAYYETLPDTFALYKVNAEGKYAKIGDTKAVNGTKLVESLIIETKTGNCYWSIGGVNKEYTIEPLEGGEICISLVHFSNDAKSIIRLYNAAIMPMPA